MITKPNGEKYGNAYPTPESMSKRFPSFPLDSSRGNGDTGVYRYTEKNDTQWRIAYKQTNTN